MPAEREEGGGGGGGGTEQKQNRKHFLINDDVLMLYIATSLHHLYEKRATDPLQEICLHVQREGHTLETGL